MGGLLFTIFMQFVFSLIFFNFTISNFTSSMLSPLCHSYERSALLQFKESLTIIRKTSSYYIWDPCHPKTASWKPEEANIDCCLWDGVECNENTGHVIKLDLSNSCLQGFINSSSGLFKLVHLEWLDLAFNYFICSEIPPEIINLSRLSYLNLSSAGFFGQIPSEILELSNLVSLDLSHNSYYNLIELKEPNLGNLVKKLTNLKELALGGVTISSPIPHSLANLSSLTLLSLSGCELRGRIPSLLGNLTKLMYLDLSFNNLLGELPTSIGNLDCLKRLDISWNELSGELPASIGNLASLEQLELSLNRFRGKTPHSMGNFTRLYWLSLASNDFSGELPASFGNLRSLEGLDISECKFSSQIPSSLRNLAQLKFLEFSHNNFSGPIDLDMFLVNFKHLEHLSLSSNRLSLFTKAIFNTSQKFNFVGLRSCNLNEFPNFLKNQHYLEVLDLSCNKIHGKVPKWLIEPSMQNFSYLNLSHNFLIGFYQHPMFFPRNYDGFTLDLSYNYLQGPLPVPPPQTKHYLVSNNSLTGKIPFWICNSSNSLEILDLSYNNLSGLLPQCLDNFSDHLSILDLQHNKFCGSIPQTFLSGRSLMMIDLSDNLLQGRIPRSLVNCSSLKFLDLGNNQISGTFPSWLGTLRELNVLILKSNKLHGMIREPNTGCGFPELRIIDLSNNRFTGKLPSKYFQCWNAMQVVNTSELRYMEGMIYPFALVSYAALGIYDYSLTMSNKGQMMSYDKVPNFLTGVILSSNRFDGEIPTSIANLKGLQVLSLANNSLHGHILSCLGNLTGLESLDLSNNKFSGQIPQQLVDLTFLEFFNVSNNNLTGPIPQGNQFPTFDKTSFNGNLWLCGKPLPKECENDEAPTNEDQVEGSEESLLSGTSDWKIILIGYAGGLIVGVVLGLNFSIGILEWFSKKFGMQPKRRRRIRRARNRM
ncbi:hypothetical protein CICLE_v10000193mg [Citrus x clementina]|uniref:Uncharacterized protein n=1 Tax=Citrus clementina TaxID=85681 RepID=V4T040_CITCL|nr:hypothetical protein CICLE_v10000193mg [Citrus x clementina]